MAMDTVVGGGPKRALPPPPTPTDPTVAKAQADAADAEKKIKGRASTYLTQGDLSGANVFKRQLLGS